MVSNRKNAINRTASRNCQPLMRSIEFDMTKLLTFLTDRGWALEQQTMCRIRHEERGIIVSDILPISDKRSGTIPRVLAIRRVG